MTPALRLEVTSPGFFAIPLKKVQLEDVPETGRVYFLHKGQIIAVARPADPQK